MKKTVLLLSAITISLLSCNEKTNIIVPVQTNVTTTPVMTVDSRAYKKLDDKKNGAAYLNYFGFKDTGC